MKRKVFSCLVFAALLGAGMVSVTSCADYDDDIKALQNQINNQGNVQETIKKEMDGMAAQIAALQGALNSMKSCTCGDVDAKIASEIEKALKEHNYATPADVAAAINNALAGLNTGLTQEEVEALIKAYHDAHPGVSASDVETLIKKYLAENPGLSESDVEAIIKAYNEAHPSSSLTENDVKSIVETYINQLQHYTKEQIEAMINTAITQALANYATTSDVYTKSQVDALIAALQLGLSESEVKALIDAALKNKNVLSESEVQALIDAALKNVKPGLTEAEVKALIDEAKCQCGLTSEDVSTIATSVIEKYMQEHPYTLDTAAVESICTSVINNSQVINNIKTAIQTLENTVSDIQAHLNNIYTKEEVETVINALIAEANKSITPEQEVIINSLIEQAIANYNTAHPDCNCQYDADAFKELVDAVAGLVTTDDLQNAINEVKNLIPTSADLSNYVLKTDLVEINNTIAAADAKAQQALDKANANGELIEALQTSVQELNDLYLNLNDELDKVARKAESALSRAISNYFEIETLKALYQQLKDYVDGDLQDKLDKLATKEELKEQIDDVKEIIGELKDDKTVAEHIDDILERLEKVEEDIEDIQDMLNELTKKLDALTKLITGIELQGSVNPAFGYYALPMGITSNVLISYYGEADYDVHFPAIEDEGLVYKEGKNWITEEDAERLGWNKPYILTYNGGSVLMNEDGNAGKLYLTLNPSNVDFTGTSLKLVNSLGQESPVKLGALKKSNDKLTFGMSRATSTYFYEAPATLSEENRTAAAFPVNKQLTNALEDVAKNKLKADITGLAQAIYNEFNGVLDAYAVQASWTDDLGEHTVTSNYGIAATAAKPLSYGFLAGKSFQIPTITPLSELNIDLNDYIKLPDFDFTFDGIDASQYSDGFKVKVHFSDVWIAKEAKTDKDGVPHPAGSIWTNVYMEEYIKSDGDIEKAPEYMVEEEFCLVDADGTFNGPVYDNGDKPSIDPSVLSEAQIEAINALIALLVEDRSQVWSAQLQKGLQTQVVDKLASLVDDINKMIADVSENLEGNLSGKLQDMIDNANNKLNSALGKGDRFINQVNKLINSANSLISNPNARLQSVVLYEDANGALHPMSTVKATPTFVSGDGAAIELKLTSYTGEVLAPAFKKYVAVTNVYRGSENADTDAALMNALKYANDKSNFNEVIEGDHYAVAFCPDKSVKGATYEIVYSALDFHGKVSQRKYYVRVK